MKDCTKPKLGVRSSSRVKCCSRTDDRPAESLIKGKTQERKLSSQTEHIKVCTLPVINNKYWAWASVQDWIIIQLKQTKLANLIKTYEIIKKPQKDKWAEHWPPLSLWWCAVQWGRETDPTAEHREDLRPHGLFPEVPRLRSRAPLWFEPRRRLRSCWEARKWMFKYKN